LAFSLAEIGFTVCAREQAVWNVLTRLVRDDAIQRLGHARYRAGAGAAMRRRTCGESSSSARVDQ
jgi:hypothetical protein